MRCIGDDLLNREQEDERSVNEDDQGTEVGITRIEKI